MLLAHFNNYFNNYLFFKFISKCQIEILRCVPLSSCVCDFSSFLKSFQWQKLSQTWEWTFNFGIKYTQVLSPYFQKRTFVVENQPTFYLNPSSRSNYDVIVTLNFPAEIYIFKVNNKDTRTMPSYRNHSIDLLIFWCLYC